MGNLATGSLSFFEDERARTCFHFKSTAQIKILNIDYHFECMSRWEKEGQNLSFDSYEEKDFSKNIRKKWELNPEGVSFVEDKKGLVLERELLYFTDEKIDNIFDPLSAVIQLLIDPLRPAEQRPISIFGKQRIIKVNAYAKSEIVQFTAIDGMNSVWSKLISNLKLKISDHRIQEAKVPSPIGIGHICLKFKESKQIGSDRILSLLKSFNS
jgi:hypothetical protein